MADEEAPVEVSFLTTASAGDPESSADSADAAAADTSITPGPVASRSIGGGNFAPTAANEDDDGKLMGLYYNGANVEEPLSSKDLSSSIERSAEANNNKPQRHLPCHRQQLASKQRWILIGAIVALAALVLGIALPLTLGRQQQANNDEPNAASSSSSSSKNNNTTMMIENGPTAATPTTTTDNNTATAAAPPVTPLPTSSVESVTPAPTALEGNQQILRQALQQVIPTDLYERMTIDPASSEYAAFQYLQQDDPAMVDLTLQRFLVALWSNAVGGTAFEPDVSECQWDGVQCDSDNIVRSINWSNRTLAGRLPDPILASLTSIDLGENALRGSIPTSWYQNATSLEYLYLHNNALAGTISTQVAQWTSLRRLYLGGNQLTGSLPPELGRARALGMLFRK
jgi:Leucine rich repeat